MEHLVGKVAVVTGASRGIGLAISEALAEEGCRVVMAARSRDELAAHVAGIVRTRGPVAIGVPTDMAQPEQVRALFVLAAATFGGVDILVNNAGSGIYGGIHELELTDLRALFDINFFGAVTAMQESVRAMRLRGGGTIVNISSIVGKFAQPLGGGYSASKHALQAVSQAARVELSHEGIDVVVVCPGLTETDFARHTRISVPGMGKSGGVKDAPIPGVSPRKVALRTVRAIRRGEREAFVSWYDRLIVSAAILFPIPFEWGLHLIARYRRHRFSERRGFVATAREKENGQ